MQIFLEFIPCINCESPVERIGEHVDQYVFLQDRGWERGGGMREEVDLVADSSSGFSLHKKLHSKGSDCVQSSGQLLYIAYLQMSVCVCGSVYIYKRAYKYMQ